VVGDDVSDVFHAGDVEEEALEAEAEAGVRGGAEAAEVEIPPLQLKRQAEFGDSGFEHVQALLAPGAADDLANARAMQCSCF